MTQSPVYTVENANNEVQRAVAAAQATFKFMYRELSWERRRVIPGLDLAAVKISFPVEPVDASSPTVENMWVTDVLFDGLTIRGELMNEPHWVTSLNAGDLVEAPLTDLNDWMYVCGGRVFGAFTVDAMRSDMDPDERAGHDEAWGLDFGEPGSIELVMTGTDRPLLRFSRDLDSAEDRAALAELERAEHPMAVNVQDSIEQNLADDPALVAQTDDNGQQYLHRETLAGNYGFVEALLRHGADPEVRDSNGRTPLTLAKMAGWPRIVELLEARSPESV